MVRETLVGLLIARLSMSYPVTVYENFDEAEILDSESFESMGDALQWASDQAWELDIGEGVEQLEGAPDFVAEYDVLGTDAVVVVKKSGLM